MSNRISVHPFDGLLTHTRSTMPRPRPSFLLPCVLLVAAAGCDRGFPKQGPGPTIDEDRFVAVMSEMRVAVLGRPVDLGDPDILTSVMPSPLTPEEREEILGRHGVSTDDLYAFVNRYGPDVPVMHRVWARVDSIVSAADGMPELDDGIGGLPGASDEAR